MVTVKEIIKEWVEINRSCLINDYNCVKGFNDPHTAYLSNKVDALLDVLTILSLAE